MYDTDYSLPIRYIRYTIHGVADMPTIPVPDKNRIHPMDRKFYKLVKTKQKLFILGSK